MHARALVAAFGSFLRVRSFVSEFQEYSVPTVGTGALIVLFIEAAAAVGVKSYFDSQSGGIDNAPVPVAAVIVFALVSSVMLIGLARDLWRSRVHTDAFRPPAYCAMVGHVAIVSLALAMGLSR
jgi:hypothetical protein